MWRATNNSGLDLQDKLMFNVVVLSRIAIFVWVNTEASRSRGSRCRLESPYCHSEMWQGV
jgi:hypothetical protein